MFPNNVFVLFNLNNIFISNYRQGWIIGLTILWQRLINKRHLPRAQICVEAPGDLGFTHGAEDWPLQPRNPRPPLLLPSQKLCSLTKNTFLLHPSETQLLFQAVDLFNFPFSTILRCNLESYEISSLTKMGKLILTHVVRSFSSFNELVEGLDKQNWLYKSIFNSS